MKKFLSLLIVFTFVEAGLFAQQGCADVTWTASSDPHPNIPGQYIHSIFITISGGTQKRALVFPKYNNAIWDNSFPQCLVVGSYTFTQTNAECCPTIALDFITYTGANQCQNGSECSCSPNDPLSGSISGGTSPICLGSSTGTMTLSGHSLNTSLQWQVSYNGGSWVSANGANSLTTYSTIPSAPGIYEFRVRVASPCPTGFTRYTNIISIVVNPTPAVTVNSATRCSAGPASTITATPNPTTPNPTGTYNYSWAVPAGASSPGNVASFDATVAGTYAVTITNSGSSCTGTGSGVLTVNPSPTVTVNSPTICASAGSATITANPSTGPFSYAWAVPSGAAPVGNVASFTANVAGTYTVTVTNTATLCTGTESGTLTINPNPTVSVNSPTICASAGSATIAATPSAGTFNYAWSVPAGAPDPGNVANFNATFAGNYTVTITNVSTTCTATGSGTMTINPNPTCTILGASAVCETSMGNSYSTTVGMSSYLWTISGNATINGPINENVVSVHAGNPGTYLLTSNITNSNGCASACNQEVTVNANPLAGSISGGTSPICVGTPTGLMTLSGYTPGSTFQWLRNGDPISGATSDSYNDPGPSPAGIYEYRVQVTNNGCTSTSSFKSITVDAMPNPGTLSPTNIFVEIPTNTETGDMTLGGFSGGSILMWQKRLEPSTTWTDINTTANPYSDPLTTVGTWHYRVAVQNGACIAYSPENSVFVTQAIPQPVELLHFTGKPIGRTVELTWSTASEADNEGFTIERSSDGIEWKQLAFLPGHGTTTEFHAYTYTDKLPVQGANYYRLSQRDFNGKTEYFKVVAVSITTLAAPFQIYPNPAKEQITVISTGEGATSLRLFDVFGRLCMSSTLSGNEEVFSLSNLAAGVYQVVLTQNGQVWTEKLLVK